MHEVLILFIVFSVPLTAILSRTWLKARELDARGVDPKLGARLDALAEENERLRARVEALEAIVTEVGPSSLAPAKVEPLPALEAPTKRPERLRSR